MLYGFYTCVQFFGFRKNISQQDNTLGFKVCMRREGGASGLVIGGEEGVVE